jgi:hypothetical protein
MGITPTLPVLMDSDREYDTINIRHQRRVEPVATHLHSIRAAIIMLDASKLSIGLSCLDSCACDSCNRAGIYLKSQDCRHW